MLFNIHFNPNLEKYLDNYLELKKQDDLLNMLLTLYLISEIFSGKSQYNLNDISGFIDLFDGVFNKLNGKKEEISWFTLSKIAADIFDIKDFSMNNKELVAA